MLTCLIVSWNPKSQVARTAVPLGLRVKPVTGKVWRKPTLNRWILYDWSREPMAMMFGQCFPKKRGALKKRATRLWRTTQLLCAICDWAQHCAQVRVLISPIIMAEKTMYTVPPINGLARAQPCTPFCFNAAGEKVLMYLRCKNVSSVIACTTLVVLSTRSFSALINTWQWERLPLFRF